MTKTARRIAMAVLFAAVGAMLAPGAPAQAATRYDGTWSVLIITQRGTCDAAYRYGLRIANGAVRYDGGAPVSVSGRVNANGAVTVSVASSAGRAAGSGRLTSAGGSGTWRGSGSQASCAGRWTAERRG